MSNYKTLIVQKPWANDTGTTVTTPTSGQIESGYVGATSAVAGLWNYNFYTQQALTNSLIRQGVPVWNTSNNYSSGSVTQYSGTLYISLVDNNTGNQPDTSGASWKSLKFSKSVYLTIAANLSDVANKVTAFTNIKQQGTTTYAGVLQYATQTEVNAGTDNTKMVSPLTTNTFIETNYGAVPVSTVVWFSSGDFSTSRNGFLPCNGGAVSRTTYADLFARISTTYGAGDGSTTFNVPNLAGRFLRGFGGNSGSMGEVQGQAMLNATGSIYQIQNQNSSSVTKNGVFSTSTNQYLDQHARGYLDFPYWQVKFALRASNNINTRSDIRPVNYSLVPFIKY